MIRTESHLNTAFGGAAGYLAWLFVALSVVSYIHENYRLTPRKLFKPQEIFQSSPRTPAVPTRPTPETPDSVIPRSIPLDPSDLLPQPKDYARDVALLRGRALLFPLKGMPRTSMRNSFRDPRGEGRLHEGVDILAPRNTPVLAVEDGKIGRLWKSKAGGITIYQLDSSNEYVYYYAHLEKYADNLKEGQSVKKGQVIGYVGTSGNAPPNTPHLHFAIYRASQPGRWWNGTPIDPYPVYP